MANVSLRVIELLMKADKDNNTFNFFIEYCFFFKNDYLLIHFINLFIQTLMVRTHNQHLKKIGMYQCQ